MCLKTKIHVSVGSTHCTNPTSNQTKIIENNQLNTICIISIGAIAAAAVVVVVA